MSQPMATLDFASLLSANAHPARVTILEIKEAYKPDAKEKKHKVHHAKNKQPVLHNNSLNNDASDLEASRLVQKLISKTPTYLNVVDDDDDDGYDGTDDIIQMVRSWPRKQQHDWKSLPPSFHEVSMGNWEDEIQWEGATATGTETKAKDDEKQGEEATALALMAQPRNPDLDTLVFDDSNVSWEGSRADGILKASRVHLILELGIAGQSVAKQSLPVSRPLPFDQTQEYQRRFDWPVSSAAEEKQHSLHQNKEAMASQIEARQKKRAHMALEKTRRVTEALGTVDLGGGKGRTITSSLMGPGGTERTGRPARGVTGSTETHDAEYLEQLDMVYNHVFSKPELSIVELRQLHRPKLPLSFVRRDRVWQFQIRYIPTPKKTDVTAVNSSYMNQFAGSTSHAKIRSEADLNPTEGQLVLLEYCEERPPIQLNKGMSSKIVNYYRGDKSRCPVSAGGGDRPTRRKRNDVTSATQKVESSGKLERPPRLKGLNAKISVDDWIGKAPKKKHRDEHIDQPKIDILPEGVTEILTKHVHGPFLGKIEEGICQTGLVNNLFVAPMFRHEPESTDFLMILGKRFIGAGKRQGLADRMSVVLRPLPSSMYVVGQVEPRERGLVHAPQTSGEKEFLKHFVSYHVAKHLTYFERHEGRGLNFNEIVSMWAGSGIQNTSLRQRIKIVAEYDSNTQIWESRPISDDGEYPDSYPGVEALGRKIAPEGIVCYETACAATRRLQDIGINTLYVGTGATVQAVSLAIAYIAGKAKVDDARKQAKRMSQALEAAKAPKSKVPSFKITMYEKAYKKLDDLYKELKRKNEVAQFIFEELCFAPWHLTFEFIDVHKHAHGPGQLELTGFADPSGVGEGFDFRRAADKAKAKGKKGIVLSSDGALKAQIKKITGTDNDLRKLTMKQMGAMLRSFNMPQSKIDTLKRWDRVHVIRDLSTKAASDGVGEHSRFARGEKMKLSEQKEDYQQRIQTIWNRQRTSLSSDAGDLRQAGQSGDGDGEDDGVALSEAVSPTKKLKEAPNTSDDDSEDEGLEAMLMDDFQDERAGNQFLASQKDSTEESKQDARDLAALRRNQEEQKATQDGISHAAKAAPTNRSMVGKKVVRRRITKTHADGTQTITFKFIFSEDEIEKVRMQKREQGMSGMRSRKHKQVHRQNDRMYGHAMFEDDDNYELASTEIHRAHSTAGRKGGLVKGAKVRKPIAQAGRMRSKLTTDKRLKKRKKEMEEAELYVAPSKRKKLNNRRERGASGRRQLPHVRFSQKLEEIRLNVERFPSSGPFSRPVDRRKIPHYYEKISDPIDLQTIRDKNQKFQYKTADSFLREFALMKSNAEKFNGVSHPLAMEASRIYDQVKHSIEADRAELTNMENELLEMNGGKKKKKTPSKSPTDSVTVDGLVLGYDLQLDDDSDSDDSGAEITILEETG